MNNESDVREEQEKIKSENKNVLENEVKGKSINEEQVTTSEDSEKKDETNRDNASEVDNIELIKEELAQTKDKLLRALAENENTRKQMEKIRQESIKYGVQPLAREILSVVDNFDRALNLKSDTDDKALEEGFTLIKKEILDILEKFNIKKIDAKGESFDANYHQAMFERETASFDEGVICEVVQEGYKFHDRLLRPVLVGVAKKPSSEEKTENKPSKKEAKTDKE